VPEKLLSCSEECLNVFYDHADKYNSWPCTAYLIFSTMSAETKTLYP
jgi:hypothetical protein